MAGERQTEPHKAERPWVKELVDTHRPWQIAQSMNDLVDRAELAETEAARLRATEPHQAGGVIYDCPHAEVCKTCPCSHEDDACFPGERLRAEVARLRAERDEARAQSNRWEHMAREREPRVAEMKARADAAVARVAELEAERDAGQRTSDAVRGDLHGTPDEWPGRQPTDPDRGQLRDAATPASGRGHQSEQDRIDRAVTERTAALEAALREAISWSYGEDVTPERRDEIERGFLASTRTQEAE